MMDVESIVLADETPEVGAAEQRLAGAVEDERPGHHDFDAISDRETLPYMRWRLDSRYRFTLTNRRVRRNPSDYIRDNFSVTTSGQFSDVPLHAALAAMGPGESCSQSTIPTNPRQSQGGSWTRRRYPRTPVPLSAMKTPKHRSTDG
jgi:hypothetical protein